MEENKSHLVWREACTLRRCEFGLKPFGSPMPLLIGSAKARILNTLPPKLWWQKRQRRQSWGDSRSIEDDDKICLQSKLERTKVSLVSKVWPQCCSPVWTSLSKQAFWNRELIISRSFLLRTYPTMKKHNPHTPILIREASDTQPKVWARYGTL
jgi:hypothetical protein